MNKKSAYTALSVVIFLAAMIITARLTRPPAVSGDTLLFVHCGNSMRPAAEKLAEIFTRTHGVAVQFNYGGSSSLLPHILARGEGDVFITHDPFSDRLAEAGLLEREEVIGALEVVVMTPKDSGIVIGAWEDLLRPGLRVGVTDPRYTTAAQFIEDALREATGVESFTAHPNFVMQTRTHGDVATALVTGHLDVALVWNFIAFMSRDKADAAPVPGDMPPTRVTACQLSSARNPQAAAAFLELAASEEGRKVFEEHGYSTTLHP